MSQTITIIGGGIIGLSSAYFLNKAGHRVIVFDKSESNPGCSYGNAGMIVPSHFIPLASPGMIKKGIRWMFDSQSPFYIKPRYDWDLIKWGFNFYRHANDNHVRSSIGPLKELHLFSKSLYNQWAAELNFDFGYQARGLLMLYQTSSTEREEKETAHLANEIGIEARVLNSNQVQELEPDVKVKVRGGVYFPGDAHLTPQLLMAGLTDLLKSKGVRLVKEEVLRFDVSNSRIKKIFTDKNEYELDELVLSAGIWSSHLAQQLKINLPMQAGKGYSFTIPNMTRNTRIPSIFLEARVAVTPMANSLRFGGTMEIGGITSSINMNRIKGIVNSIPKYYPELNFVSPKTEDVWFGLRPCPPDGMPYVGRSNSITNLILATGHSMMGLSLGPATGQLVQQMVDRIKTSVEIKAFNPNRFS